MTQLIHHFKASTCNSRIRSGLVLFYANFCVCNNACLPCHIVKDLHTSDKQEETKIMPNVC